MSVINFVIILPFYLLMRISEDGSSLKFCSVGFLFLGCRSS